MTPQRAAERATKAAYAASQRAISGPDHLHAAEMHRRAARRWYALGDLWRGSVHEGRAQGHVLSAERWGGEEHVTTRRAITPPPSEGGGSFRIAPMTAPWLGWEGRRDVARRAKVDEGTVRPGRRA